MSRSTVGDPARYTRGVGGLARVSVVFAGLFCLGGCYSGAHVDAAASASGSSGGGGDAGEGEDGGSTGAEDEDDTPAGFEAPRASMRRLTAAQYRNSVADVFGIDASDIALDLDETSEMFSSIGASRVGTSKSGVELYRNAAFDVTTAVFADRAAQPELADCAPSGSEDACVRDAIATIGRRLWRRPLTDAELERYASLVDVPHEDGADPDVGFRYAIAALLESPNFIYLPAVDEIAPNGLRRYTDWEVAARLSYTLWNSTPDDELLDAASEGELTKSSGLQAQTARMLEDDRAADLLARLFGEAWNLDRLNLEAKNPDTFPRWSEEVLGDFRTEFGMVLEDAFSRDVDVRRLFDGKTTFANAALADLYGIPAGDGSATDFVPTQLGDDRFGVLTSGAVLAANSPSDRSSPTLRGVFVLERFLCGMVPPPPPDVDDTLPTSSEEPRSTRDILEEHRVNPSCAGCHNLVDPLGLVLEHYDGIGMWRDTENGFEIDPSGEYGDTSFGDAKDLAAFLAADPRVTSCIARQSLAYSIGIDPHGLDEEALSELGATFEASEYAMRDLLVAVVTSPSFRYFSTEEDS